MTETEEHLTEVLEWDNGALETSCSCGWVWGYLTGDAELAEAAAAEHLDTAMSDESDGDDEDG